MKEQEQKDQKQENPKEQMDKKNLSGTEQEKEKSLLEKASDTIAGDKTLMGTVLKFLLSPVSLLTCAGIIIYCFFKIKGQKEEIEKLKTENKKLTDEKEELEEDFEKTRKKYKKLKSLNEEEAQNNISGLGFPLPKVLPQDSAKKKTYSSAFLD